MNREEIYIALVEDCSELKLNEESKEIIQSYAGCLWNNFLRDYEDDLEELKETLKEK